MLSLTDAALRYLGESFDDNEEEGGVEDTIRKDIEISLDKTDDVDGEETEGETIPLEKATEIISKVLDGDVSDLESAIAMLTGEAGGDCNCQCPEEKPEADAGGDTAEETPQPYEEDTSFVKEKDEEEIDETDESDKDKEEIDETDEEDTDGKKEEIDEEDEEEEKPVVAESAGQPRDNSGNSSSIYGSFHDTYASLGNRYLS